MVQQALTAASAALPEVRLRLLFAPTTSVGASPGHKPHAAVAAAADPGATGRSKEPNTSDGSGQESKHNDDDGEGSSARGTCASAVCRYT